MSNTTLRDYQSTGLDEVLASITFKVNGGGAPEVESPPLDILKTGIRLHFFRYGLFKKEAAQGKDHFVIYAPDDNADHNCDFQYIKPYVFEQQQLDDAVINSELNPPEGASAPQNYYYQRTCLNEGYIYIIDDANPELHKEYKVDQFGNLTNISWDHEQNKENGTFKDVRIPTKKDKQRITNYHLVHKKGAQLWTCFSPVQWSVAYHQKMRDDQELRQQRMQMVDCSGILKNGENCLNDIYPCKDVMAYFTSDQRNEAIWLQRKLHDITEDETQQQDEIYEDMFVTLHDPFSCADTLCDGVEYEIERLQSIMLSCKTGIPSDEIFNKIRENADIVIEENTKNRQIECMFLLAIATYKFIFNDPGATIKYRGYKPDSWMDQILKYTPAGLIDRTVGNALNKEHGYGQSGASRQKLEKILGVAERRRQRNIINQYRDDLGTFITSDYYQDIYDDYLEAAADFVEIAKWTAAHHKEILSKYPNQFDRELDLEHVYQIKKDHWIKEVGKTLDPDPPLFKKSTLILDKELFLKSYVVLSLTKKTNSTMGKILKAYGNHGDYVNGKGEFKVLTKLEYLKRDFKTREAFISFNKSGLHEYLKTHSKEIDFGVEGNTKANFREYEKTMHKLYGNISRQKGKELIDNGAIKVNYKNIPKKHTTAVKDFLNSTKFATVVLAFEVMSLTRAIKKRREKDSRLNNLQEKGAGIKLGAALVTLARNTGVEERLGRKFAEVIARMQQTEVTEEILGESSTRIRNIGNIVKIAGSTVTVATAAKDAYQAGSYRDYDAMGAYSAAGAVGAVFIVSDLSMYFGTGALALGFWPAAILGGVLIGLYAVAQLLKDTELQAYFKNYPFSDYAILPNASELPHQYIHRLYESVDRAVEPSSYEWISESKFVKYRNFETAYIGFMDMIAPHTVYVGARYDAGTTLQYNSDLHAHRFRAHLQFFQYFNDPQDLDIKIWFYPYGLNTQEKVEITMMYFDFPKDRQLGKSDNPPRCYVDFGLPVGYKQGNFGKALYPKGEVLFLCRLKTHDRHFIPLEQQNEARYYYSIAQVYNQIDLSTPKPYYDKFGLGLYHIRNPRVARIKDTTPEDAERVIRLKDVSLLRSFPLT
ncbi:toxin VasX [Aquimarina algicola]|uniref:Toxin VasX N-terminal region domain-containing protein n=1 Tax=Aquimarina algicola TaxID=2589995 RepID=A0A504IW78_9FLAO|nr:toxin VasX [Aquimarina algicola]TPN82747.1 hypothetical protein FHK87_20175 [Aquimarina algicola]